MTTGLTHGPLAGQDLTKLTGLSVLHHEGGDLLTFVEPMRNSQALLNNRARVNVTASWSSLTYLGEWSDDTRTVILAPEGGWRENPVPGRRLDGWAVEGEWFDMRRNPHHSDNLDWPRITSIRLIEDPTPTDRSADLYGEGERHTALMEAVKAEIIRQHPDAFTEDNDFDLVISSPGDFIKIDTSSIAEALLG